MDTAMLLSALKDFAYVLRSPANYSCLFYFALHQTLFCALQTGAFCASDMLRAKKSLDR